MQRATGKRRIVSHAPMAAIVLSQSAQRDRQSRFGFILVVFMRMIAALWLFEGLTQWAAVMATNVDGQSGVAALSSTAISAVVFFAVINPIACVGLWLATPWGGAIWLVTAGAQLLVALLMPGFYDHAGITAALTLLLVAIYLALTWLAANAGDWSGNWPPRMRL